MQSNHSLKSVLETQGTAALKEKLSKLPLDTLLNLALQETSELNKLIGQQGRYLQAVFQR